MPEKKPVQGKLRPAKKSPAGIKPTKSLHPRNKHNQGYDFAVLIKALPKLSQFVRPNPYGNLSIDFSCADAVKTLNAALLKSDYQIDGWDIPKGFLCPPIPGRVDYLHYIADLLADKGKVPTGQKVCALDIGTGANGVYSLLGIQCYGWRFIASDIDSLSIENVNKIASENPKLASKLELIHQTDAKHIFTGVIQPNQRIDVTLCNPPFHESLADAMKGSQRKVANLAANRVKKQHGNVQNNKPSELNFGGQKAELWCEGGEIQFLRNMITESVQFKHQVLWFTTLVSKSENLKPCYALLEKCAAKTVKTIEMHQGNKQTRILVWSFLAQDMRAQWAKLRI
ncbi:23S rRNA (adenine(1618)-N(6))-methyltransferase RlmF [Shewanella gaetbuli]